MEQENTKPELTPDQIIDQMIRQLLAKPESDEELEIELFGYPADYLDVPNRSKMVLREYREVNYRNVPCIEFDLVYFNRGDLIGGLVLSSNAPLMKLDIEIWQAYIETSRLRKLLNDNMRHSFIRPYGKGEKLVVRIPKQLLLDNSEIV